MRRRRPPFPRSRTDARGRHGSRRRPRARPPVPPRLLHPPRLRRRQFGGEHEELVSRVTSHEVHRARGLAQPPGGLAQQLVSAGRAEALVDEAEAVEVDVQDGHVAVGSPRPIDGRLHLRGKEAAVGEFGELIVVAQVLDPPPVVLAFGYVAHQRHERSPRAPLEQPDARLDRKRVPVAAPGGHLDRARPTAAQRVVGLGQCADGARVLDEVARERPASSSRA